MLNEREQYSNFHYLNKQKVMDIIFKHLSDKRIENDIPYAYLDSTGNPTIGIGDCIKNKDKARFMSYDLYTDPHGKNLATREQKEAYWSELLHFEKEFNGQYKHHGWGNYRQLEQSNHNILYLDPKTTRSKTIGNVISPRLEDMKKIFHHIDKAPISAQVAVFDILYNRGYSGISRLNHGNFARAVKASDWTAAAFYSSRGKDVSVYRNNITRKLLLDAQRTEMQQKDSVH